MLSLLLLTLINLFSWTEGTCPDITGGSVPWWILYQQKQTPFIHYYVDSSDTEKIKMHHPEKTDSVLSRLILGLIEDDSSQYIVYFNDLVNAGNIAKSVEFPMKSKWIYGMLATHTSWASGFWVMSNNFLFPPTIKGHLVAPGTKQWTSSTVGESDDDLFYVCLTAGNENDINSMLDSILAGNPFVFLEKLAQGSRLKHRLKEVEIGLDTSFYLEASATSFLGCLYSTTDETLQNCLYKYSISEGAPISVFTRPRGMIQTTRTFCYSGNSKTLYDFSVLENTSSNNRDWSNSMFVLTDQLDNNDAGITCFGQDIAANTETVSIMICTRLPDLYRNLLTLSKITKWTCPQQTPLQLSTDKTMPETTNEPSTITSKTFIATSSGMTPNGLLQCTGGTEDPDEKMYNKMCKIINCNKHLKYHFNKGRKMYKYVHEKTSNLEKWFEETATDMRMQENVREPIKVIKDKTIVKMKSVIEVQFSADVERYLITNENAVLGLFCRKGYGHCQEAKNEITYLSQTLDLDKLDIVFVSTDDPMLPCFLTFTEEPTIGYKSRGINKWTKNKMKGYDKISLTKFVNEMMMSDKSQKTTANTIVSLANNPNYIEAEKAVVPHPDNLTAVLIIFETKKGKPDLHMYDAQPYNPKVHDTTIGYGFNLNREDAEETFRKVVPSVDFNKVKRGEQNITAQQALDLLNHDMQKRIEIAEQNLTYYNDGEVLFKSLKPNVQNAIVNALYRGDLGHKTRGLMRKKQWRCVSDEYLNFQQYRDAEKKGIIGIRKRMNWNAEQFTSMIKN